LLVSFSKPTEGVFFAFEEDTCFFVFLLTVFADGLVAEGFGVAFFAKGFALADDVVGFVEVFDSASAGTGDGHNNSMYCFSVTTLYVTSLTYSNVELNFTCDVRLNPRQGTMCLKPVFHVTSRKI
jgi:hypothetical protein